ncbi:MAG: hypothetical protein M3Z09_10790 [Acidobacteriota bacterium]|nr:hypothetical protein [Acidobacteriota bacterium]
MFWRNLFLRFAFLCFAALTGGSCSRPPGFHADRMELWYWHHSYLSSPHAVETSKALLDRAARAGYTGVALWDSSWIFMSEPDWPEQNRKYLAEVVAHAAQLKLRILPVVAPYGHSNDLLKHHPDWSEGQRVVGARFQVDPGGRARLLPSLSQSAVPDGPLLTLQVNLTPWRQYSVRFAVRTRGFHGIAQTEVTDGPANRLDGIIHARPDQDWTAEEYTFNSASSGSVRIMAGAFGPHSGAFELARFSMEETALRYMVRGAGAPVRFYDPSRPAIAFDGGHLPPGQVIAMDYYAAIPIYDEALDVCLTEPKIAQWMTRNASDASALTPHGSGLFLSYDEMRHMNSCALCRARRITPGALLAANIRSMAAQTRRFGPLYVWSDMFDPLHNAVDHFFMVEGSLRGSWKGLDPDITVVNWNLQHLRPSLLWFSGDDPRQRVPHRQIIAGYYDPSDHDGAAAARLELAEARSIPGIAGIMYTTWRDDYSQLEQFAKGAREEWTRYRGSRP